MARLDQQLAVTAWTAVEQVPQSVRQEFRTRAVGLGPLLASSGLAATAAFLAAKSGPENPAQPLAQAYRLLGDALARHVLADPTSDRNVLVRRAGELDPAGYRRASADARRFASWIRRAAEALIRPAANRRPSPDSPASDDTGEAG